MKEKNKEFMKEELESVEQESEMLSDDDLDDVVGGAFENIPRVKLHQIDKNLRDKI